MKNKIVQTGVTKNHLHRENIVDNVEPRFIFKWRRNPGPNSITNSSDRFGWREGSFE